MALICTMERSLTLPSQRGPGRTWASKATVGWKRMEKKRGVIMLLLLNQLRQTPRSPSLARVRLHGPTHIPCSCSYYHDVDRMNDTARRNTRYTLFRSR